MVCVCAPLRVVCASAAVPCNTPCPTTMHTIPPLVVLYGTVSVYLGNGLCLDHAVPPGLSPSSTATRASCAASDDCQFLPESGRRATQGGEGSQATGKHTSQLCTAEWLQRGCVTDARQSRWAGNSCGLENPLRVSFIVHKTQAGPALSK